MNIEIRLFANLAQFLPHGAKNKRAKITVTDGITIEELLMELNVPKNSTNVVMLNGVHQKDDIKLSEGDVLSIIPPVTGG